MVFSLIYYKDTHAFFNRYYDELEDIRYELESEGIEVNIKDQDLKNYLAWLGFEHVAYQLYNELTED